MRHKTREVQQYRNWLKAKNEKERSAALMSMRLLGLDFEQCKWSYKNKQANQRQKI